MEVRSFRPERRHKLPGGHPGVHGVPIVMDAAAWPQARRDALLKLLGELPVFVGAPVQVEAMYFEPRGAIDPHSAPNPILFLVIAGAGFVRVGEQTRAVGAGDAVLWPAGVEHTAWTVGEPLQAIVINLPPSG